MMVNSLYILFAAIPGRPGSDRISIIVNNGDPVGFAEVQGFLVKYKKQVTNYVYTGGTSSEFEFVGDSRTLLPLIDKEMPSCSFSLAVYRNDQLVRTSHDRGGLRPTSEAIQEMEGVLLPFSLKEVLLAAKRASGKEWVGAQVSYRPLLVINLGGSYEIAYKIWLSSASGTVQIFWLGAGVRAAKYEAETSGAIPSSLPP